LYDAADELGVLRALGPWDEEWSTWATLLFGVLAVLSTPVMVLVHELGHAVVARWHGVRVEEVVVAPEGRTVAVRIGGVPIRIGLGLKREFRSTAPVGWLRRADADISDRALIQILLGGPIASAIFGALMLAARLLVPPPEPLAFFLLMGGSLSLLATVRNLQVNADGTSDGARIQQLRRGVLPTPCAHPDTAQPPLPPRLSRPPQDPRAATSVPPPSRNGGRARS
jgi:hypothetical protein